MADTAEIGIFGGSGFYSLLEDVREVKVDTPYGPPSDSLFLAEAKQLTDFCLVHEDGSIYPVRAEQSLFLRHSFLAVAMSSDGSWCVL
mgnify:CR=1 FL=1